MRVRSVTVGTPVPAPALDNRSTKAGASTPATPVPGRDPARHLAGRSTKAGASTPATLDLVDLAPPLGPRRSTKAGASTPATPPREVRAGPVHPRSTKAGASTPATPVMSLSDVTLGAVAQRRPGLPPRRHWVLWMRRKADPDAQRRPGLPPRRHVKFAPSVPSRVNRSTKAGASTPATRPSPRI